MSFVNNSNWSWFWLTNTILFALITYLVNLIIFFIRKVNTRRSDNYPWFNSITIFRYMFKFFKASKTLTLMYISCFIKIYIRFIISFSKIYNTIISTRSSCFNTEIIFIFNFKLFIWRFTRFGKSMCKPWCSCFKILLWFIRLINFIRFCKFINLITTY